MQPEPSDILALWSIFLVVPEPSSKGPSISDLLSVSNVFSSFETSPVEEHGSTYSTNDTSSFPSVPITSKPLCIVLALRKSGLAPLIEPVVVVTSWLSIGDATEAALSTSDSLASSKPFSGFGGEDIQLRPLHKSMCSFANDNNTQGTRSYIQIKRSTFIFCLY